MCGIAGIIANNSTEYKHELDKMLVALKHRGPDGSGTFFYDNCALGHVRLSIIDLSTGQQPMLGEGKRTAVTFNGEIYGYQKLRAELASEYEFQTTSDTEVILASYKKHGDKMIDRLPGMFAFALWDESKQSLFAARDRFGEKPLFYAQGENGEFIFASEIKAILATGLVEPVLSKESLVHFMRHLYVAPDKTIYANIFSLPPGHVLSWQDGQVKISRYWQMPAINESIGLAEAMERFSLLLGQAVDEQLIADVPVAAFLSGGLDSSTIVARASERVKNLHTIAFGFGDSINELPFARAVAAQYKTKHIELQAGGFDLAELLSEMQNVYDEPFADSSNIPTYLISKEARKIAKVVLTGDGGDELFGGYTSWYKPLYYQQKSPEQILASMYVNLFSGRINKLHELYYSFKGFENKILGKSLMAAHLEKNTYFTNYQLQGLLRFKSDKEAVPVGDSLDDVMRFDVANYMPGDILVKTDRASMAHGLELRAPFLNVSFAEFCLSLPYQLKINSKADKIILREAEKQRWPEEIRNRRKQGFGSPVGEWLRESKVKSLKSRVLGDKKSRIFAVLDFEAVQEFALKDNYQTWILLNLALWLEKHPEVII